MTLFRFTPDNQQFAMKLACCPFNKITENQEGSIEIRSSFVRPDVLEQCQFLYPEFSNMGRYGRVF